MKQLLTIILVVGFSALNAQNNNFLSASSPDGKYTINHLKGWTPSFNSGSELSLKANGTSVENIPIQLALTKEENLLPTTTIDNISSRNTLIIRQLLNAFILENGTSTIDGNPANWISYTYEVNGRELQGIAYFFIKGGIAYQLVVHSSEGDFRTMEPLYREIAESLEIK